MQRLQPVHRARSHVFNSTNKRTIIGNTAGTVPPAWKSGYAAQSTSTRRQTNGDTITRRRDIRNPPTGSKIIMSQLPTDTVAENDIEELFRETIGPVFNVFVIYNSQGNSKGMAVVHFQRPGDAIEARKRYNGKIIDGRRPLKIELIVDPPEVVAKGNVVMKQKTLADRLSGSTNHSNTTPAYHPRASVPSVRPQTQRRAVKKGPRRLKKSAEQLDKEMEIYMAQTPRIDSDIIAMN